MGAEVTVRVVFPPGTEADVSGGERDGFKVPLEVPSGIKRWVLVSTEVERTEEENGIFLPEKPVWLRVLRPPDPPEAKVPAAGLRGVPLVSEEELRVWVLRAGPAPDGDGRAGGAVVLATLPAPVAAVRSVRGKGTAELGAVPPVVPGVAVVTEEAALCTDSVLGPDAWAPGAEAGDRGGAPGPAALGTAELVSGEEGARLVSGAVGSWLAAPQERGAPEGEVSGREEEAAQSNGFAFPRAGASAVVVSDEIVGVGTFVWETVQSVSVSVEAGIAVGRCFVSRLLSVLLSAFAEISLREAYTPGTWPLAVSAVCEPVDASLAKAASVELVRRLALIELNPGTMLLVGEIPGGAAFACGLSDGLVRCSEVAVSLEVESARAEDCVVLP